MTPGVVFDGVWKKFRRGERHDSLRDLIPATVRRLAGRRVRATNLDTQEFWAVRDVSFEVAPGEALGVIGPNGAGKSTILKLLSRILRPTRGCCEVRGRAGALIEVAAGFHPDLTGRENVFLQGAIMGMKRAEIARKFDEIVAFAGVSEFIDTPVKRYSSGMNARLGFAIAAHLDPEVLLIDEVLSVGDAAFQDRCVDRMRGLIGRGIPLVFISHNLPAILQLCTRAIVLDHGSVRFDGTPVEAIQEYRGSRSSESERRAPALAGRPAAPLRLVRVELLNDRGEPSVVFQTSGFMRVRIHYESDRAMENAVFAVDVHRADGLYCAGIESTTDHRRLHVGEGRGFIDVTLPRVPLLPGAYAASVGIHQSGQMLDLHQNAYPFSIVSDRHDLGVVHLDRHWSQPVSRGAIAAVPSVDTPAEGSLVGRCL